MRRFVLLASCLGTVCVLGFAPAGAFAAGHAVSFRVTPGTLPAGGGFVRLQTQGLSGRCRLTVSPAARGLPTSHSCSAALSVKLPANRTRTTRGYVFTVQAGSRQLRAHATVGASVGVSAKPTVTTQPASLTVNAGATATFSAAATERPLVRWEVSQNGSTWEYVAAGTTGAQSATLTLTATIAMNGFFYRAVFTNRAGRAFSTPATLTVDMAPTVYTEPTAQTVAAGTTAHFFAAADGTPAPTPAWEVSADGGNTWSALAGQSAGALAVPATTSNNGYQYRAVFTSAAGSVSTTPATLTVTPVVSTIWAGYVVVGTDFTAVSASWVVPTLTCAAGANTRSDQWVGIDGFADATVEQDGTEADCVNGAPSYSAWWELFGDPAVNGGGSVPLPYAVFAGDQITASVTLSGATWTLTVTDTTGHWSVATPEADSSPLQAQASAEWVVEGAKPGGAPLSEFAPITFEGATATAGGTVTALSAAPYMAVQMQVGGSTLATPGAVSGNNFTVTNS